MAASEEVEGLKYGFTAEHSWGVASARHTSGVVVRDGESPYLFDAPLGPSVVRWDLKGEERVRQFQAHSDLIVCMRLSPNAQYIATCSSGGEIKLWTHSWTLVSETLAPINSLFHLGWSADSQKLVIVGNGHNSSTLFYAICKGEDQKKVTLKLLWQTPAGLSQTRESTIDKLHIQSHDISHDQEQRSHDALPTRQVPSHDSKPESHEHHMTGKDYHYGDAYYMAEINPSGNCFVVEEREKACTLIHLLDAKTGKNLKTTKLSSLDGRREVHSLLMSLLHHGSYVIMAEGGYIVVVKGEELEIVTIFNVGNSSRTCVWDGDLLILPTDSGKLTWVDITTGNKIYEFKVGSSDFIVHIDWSINGDGLMICGFSNLSYCIVERNDKDIITKVSSTYKVHTHEISCCGVGFSPDSTYLAVGDLVGNVYLYGCHIDLSVPLEMWNVGASVRCLVWLNNTSLLVGCLDGLIHYWKIEDGIKIFFAMEGSIIHMRVSHDNKYLAVGTSRGKVGVYLLEDMGVASHGGTSHETVCPVSVFLAHKPQPGKHDSRFGQLGKQAEVWSLCWSPDNGHLATCSEDQTVKVWDTRSWVGVATLTGHAMAVTSVDWKVIDGRSLLASCSDDRTIRLYEAINIQFNLLHVMSTQSIYGWHTLTYLAFSPFTTNKTNEVLQTKEPLLMVTTQHGYLVLFHVITAQMVSCHKMHCGSVEGLVWDKKTNHVATVGGDCAAYAWSVIKC